MPALVFSFFGGSMFFSMRRVLAASLLVLALPGWAQQSLAPCEPERLTGTVLRADDHVVAARVQARTC